MLKKTKLYDEHLALGATFFEFANWNMPLHYGSQVEEHQRVRNRAGVFDVSHMLSIDIHGSDAATFLRRILANDVQKLTSGKALYSCMLNPHAGIMDDLIVYRLSEDSFRIVVNAATAQKDLGWIQNHAKQYSVTVRARSDLAMLAVQGPQAIPLLQAVFPEQLYKAITELKHFHVLYQNDLLIARTGYTGEDGLEIILPQDKVVALWKAIVAQGIVPAGLGARDSLRLEAGLNLYGVDMDETVSPLESNLAWTIDWQDTQRDFIGKEGLLKQQNKGVKHQLVGVVLLAKGVCRQGMSVFIPIPGKEDMLRGKLTSGGFSPTLACSIGLARIPAGNFSALEVDIRGKRVPAKIIKPPFVSKGKGTLV